jgi:hypothetical protein
MMYAALNLLEPHYWYKSVISFNIGLYVFIHAASGLRPSVYKLRITYTSSILKFCNVT